MPKFLLSDLTIATMTDESGYGLIDKGAIAIEGSEIVWLGDLDALPEAYRDWPSQSFEGRLATPGLVDCHTHLVYGGSRAREFEMRLNGASYEEIARAGGGIVSTVKATREASDAILLKDALTRVDTLISEGVTTVEIKSGYGLDLDTEMKMLRIARQIESRRPIRVKTTFLGAHAAPKGIDADTYINDICLPALDACHAEGLVDAVDGFCEGIAFSPEQIERVFQKAQALGLPVKLHAEQLSHLGGTALAARYNALSADHVEYANAEDAKALSKAGSVAVLLPGAFYTLRETQAPPVDELRNAGVPMAIATDWNPGSSPLGSLLLSMNMGCTLFGMTPAEALAGTTKYAARALGLPNTGYLAKGMCADLAIWDVTDPAELSYRIGSNPIHKRVFGGML